MQRHCSVAGRLARLCAFRRHAGEAGEAVEQRARQFDEVAIAPGRAQRRASPAAPGRCGCCGTSPRTASAPNHRASGDVHPPASSLGRAGSAKVAAYPDIARGAREPGTVREIGRESVSLGEERGSDRFAREALEIPGPVDQDPPPAQADDAVLPPGAELPVEVLARHADQGAELGLAQLEVDQEALPRPPAVLGRKAQEPPAARGAMPRSVFSSSISVVRRSFWHSTPMRRMATEGFSSRKPNTAFWRRRKTWTGSAAVALRVRGLPSSSAISPSTCPGSMKLSTISRPSPPGC